MDVIDRSIAPLSSSVDRVSRVGEWSGARVERTFDELMSELHEK
jgi:hypothetical protein